MEKRNGKKVNRTLLYMEMILAAPGAKMHRGFRKLRKNKELSGAILFGIVILLAAVVLWQLKGNNTWLLIFSGIGLITVFFLLFSFLRKHGDMLLGVGEMLTFPFYSSYVQCRKALEQENTAHTDGSGEKKSGEAFREQGKKTENFTTEKEKKAGGKGEEPKKENDSNASSSRNESRKEEKASSSRHGSRNGEKASSGRNRSQQESRQAMPKNARLEEAKAFFGVDIPFTTEEIKQRRNQLLKKYHPDNPDGSEDMCKKINECYALLARYAA